MIPDGWIALFLYLIHPFAGIWWLLACIAQVIDVDYRGYYVVATAILGVIGRMLDMSWKR